jgi:hypothetical protein
MLSLFAGSDENMCCWPLRSAKTCRITRCSLVAMKLSSIHVREIRRIDRFYSVAPSWVNHWYTAIWLEKPQDYLQHLIFVFGTKTAFVTVDRL